MKCVLCVLMVTVILTVVTPASEDRGLQIMTIKNQSGQEIGLYQESHALIIGVSEYTAGWPDLPGVKKDVQAVKLALEDHGFRVLTVENPTRVQLEQAFTDFIHTYGQHPENRLLVYFSGHGHTLQLAYGEEMGYIIPVDAPNPYRDEPGFLTKAIDMQQIEVYAKRIQAKHALFLFDSCFSGSIFSLSRAVPESITYKTAKPVRQFITSGSAEEQVPDESIFRQQFITALQGEGDVNGDGYITGAELGEFLQSNVVNYSNGAQHPQYGKIRNPNLDKGDFVFQVSVSISVEQYPDPESTFAPVQEVDPETAMWKLIEPTENISDVRDFLAAFPDGKFARVAQLKLKQLERRQRQERPAKTLKNIFEENFENNHKEWYLIDTKDSTIKIEDGKYVFEHKREENAWLSWKSIDIDQQQDFAITVTTHKVSGVDNYGYGLAWGLKDVKNYQQFVISGNGQYRYGIVADGQWVEIIEWTPSDSINQGNATNTLSIRKSENQVQFYINDQYVNAADAKSFFGAKVGFVLYNAITVTFDNVLVKN